MNSSTHKQTEFFEALGWQMSDPEMAANLAVIRVRTCPYLPSAPRLPKRESLRSSEAIHREIFVKSVLIAILRTPLDLIGGLEYSH